MRYSDVNALILAAGKGTRMKSGRAKVLHEIFFAPMICHVLDAVDAVAPARTLVVCGHQREEVRAALAGRQVETIIQEEQLGTGHAVLAAEGALAGGAGTLLILCGDTPLVRPETLLAFVESHRASGARVTVMTTLLDNPAHYGRIITDAAGGVLRIVEEKDASDAERAVREINAGIYCVEIDYLFGALRQIGTDNKQGEMYLTDIVAIARQEGHAVHRWRCADASEILGVNSRVELAQAHRELQRRRNEELMIQGVTIIQPESVQVEKGVAIGRDTILHPGVIVRGNSAIGTACTLEPYALLTNCQIGDGVTIGAFSYLEDCSFFENSAVAPKTMVRGGDSPRPV